MGNKSYYAKRPTITSTITAYAILGTTAAIGMMAIAATIKRREIIRIKIFELFLIVTASRHNY